MSKVNEKDQNLGSKIFNLLLWILLLCFLFIPGYLFYISFVNDDISLPTKDELIDRLNSRSPGISEDDWEDVDDTEQQEEDEDIYDETPVLGENFFEKFPIVTEQQAYIAVPLRVDTQNPPSIVMYHLGTTETVEDSISTSFMEKLREYATVFTSNNYIFIASNLRDSKYYENDDFAILEINELISWVRNDYVVSDGLYLIGFSRGGYISVAYTLSQENIVSGISLLAPATYYSDWDQDMADILMDIPVKIWQGTSDEIIPIVHTRNFVERLDELGKEIPFVQVENGTHFDVDDEYIDDILDFFESTQ